MDISSGIFWGIISMVSWGASDFFVSKSARGCEPYRAFLWSQIVAMAVLVIVFFAFFNLPHFSWKIIILLLVSGALAVISNMSFYKSLEKGQVSIVMPIASCWAIITLFLSLILLNESLTSIRVLGVALAISGAILVSFKWKDLLKLKSRAKGIKYAVIAAFAYGIDFAIIDIMANDIGWFFPILFVNIIASAYLLAYVGLTKKDASFPVNIAKFIILVGILDSVAYLAYSSSVTREYGAVVAPIAATSPAISILLAKYFYKEKMEINQKLGVVAVLTGLILLAV